MTRVRLLRNAPSPVTEADIGGGVRLWVKRDDLNADLCAGNKARSLEFLLGGVHPGDTIVTLGGVGSTHVLATAIHASHLGASTEALLWDQEMNPTARFVSQLLAEHCAKITKTSSALTAFARYEWGRLHEAYSRAHGASRVPGILRRYGASRAPSISRLDGASHFHGASDAPRAGRTWFIPIGGTTPLGMLGHVNAGLELASQIEQGLVPRPETIVLPLGSGGTAAGLALGLGIAGVDTVVTAVRVAPRMATPMWRINGLIRGTRALLRRLSGEIVTPLPAVPVHIAHTAYGGAYGRPVAGGAAAAARIGIALDQTYGEKAAVVACARAAGTRGSVLLWVTTGLGSCVPSD